MQTLLERSPPRSLHGKDARTHEASLFPARVVVVWAKVEVSPYAGPEAVICIVRLMRTPAACNAPAIKMSRHTYPTGTFIGLVVALPSNRMAVNRPSSRQSVRSGRLARPERTKAPQPSAEASSRFSGRPVDGPARPKSSGGSAGQSEPPSRHRIDRRRSAPSLETALLSRP